ncbi:MAG: hypothetical protein AB1814_01885 [Thermodesulfobacteriota bacterium]
MNNNELANPNGIDKYRALYQFVRESYEQTWGRLSRLDKKAQMFLAVFALQITAMGFSLNTLRALIIKGNCLSVFLLGLTIASLLIIFVGISFLVYEMKIRKMRSFPDPVFIINEFEEDDEVDLLTSLSKRISEDRNKNEEICEAKATAIERSTYCIWVSFILIIILFVIIVAGAGAH